VDSSQDYVSKVFLSFHCFHKIKGSAFLLVLTEGLTKFSTELCWISELAKMWLPPGSYFKLPFLFSLTLGQNEFKW
jgi:hypothetical protein